MIQYLIVDSPLVKLLRQDKGNPSTSENMSRVVPTAGPSQRTSQKFKFFVFDCETSGLDAHRDRIVELAVLEYVPGQSVAEREPHSVLVNPGRRLTKKNIEIHGISDAMLKNEPSFPVAWETFLHYVNCACEEGGERPVLIAHNAGFDVNFLRSELRRAKKPLPDWDVSCSVHLARKMWPGQPAKLSDLTAKFKVTEYTEHRAGGDVQGLSEVLDNVDDILSRTGESVQQWLLEGSKSLKDFGNQQASSSRIPTRSSARLRAAISAASAATGSSTQAEFSPAGPVTTAAVQQSRPTSQAATSQRSSTRASPSSQASGKVEPKLASRSRDALRTPPRQIRRSHLNGGNTEPEARGTRTEQTETAPISFGRTSSTEVATTATSTNRSTNGTGQVFITATGECFHIDEFCYGLRKARTKSSCNRSEMPGGLRPCKVCCKGEAQPSGRYSRISSSLSYGSPTSIIPAATGAEEANYYRTPTGVKYHIRFDCYGLRNAKAKIPCDTIPDDLDPCRVCAGG